MLAATSLWLCRTFHGLAVWRNSGRWLTLAQWPADTVRQSQRVRLRCRFSTLPQQQQTTLKQLGTTTTNDTGFYMPDPLTVTHTHARTHAHTHTHNRLTALCLGKPVSEETFTHSHPRERRRRCMGAHPLYDALSQWGLLDPIKPAYNQPASQVPDPKSARWPAKNFQPAPLTDYGLVCRQSWSQYLLLCRTCCIIYQLPPLQLAIFWQTGSSYCHSTNILVINGTERCVNQQYTHAPNTSKKRSANTTTIWQTQVHTDQ